MIFSPLSSTSDEKLIQLKNIIIFQKVRSNIFRIKSAPKIYDCRNLESNFHFFHLISKFYHPCSNHKEENDGEKIQIIQSDFYICFHKKSLSMNGSVKKI